MKVVLYYLTWCQVEERLPSKKSFVKSRMKQTTRLGDR